MSNDTAAGTSEFINTTEVDSEQAMLIYTEWAAANPFEAFLRRAAADCVEPR